MKILGRIKKDRGVAEEAHEDEFPNEEDAEGSYASIENLPGSPKVFQRHEHSISRRQIDHDALKVMYRLLGAGHTAFLVGGGVRDLLLGKNPKDFDIGTDATPEEVRRLFRNSRIIGRRFKINHVYFRDGKIIEVATFRHDEEPLANIDEGEDASLLIRNDNRWGNPETDARRRDLTINGLFYDLNSFSVVDYVGGMDDLRNGVIRVIGDPYVRFREDPVRLVRTVRHAARIGFTIEPTALQAIYELADQLKLCSSARLYEELVKDFESGSFLSYSYLLDETGLLKYILPKFAQARERATSAQKIEMDSIIRNLDTAVRAGEKISPGVWLSALHFESHAEYEGEHAWVGEYYLKLYPKNVTQYRELLQKNEGKEVSPSREDRKPLQSDLRKVLEQMSFVAAIPRKEKDRMADILYARFQLMEYYFGLSRRGVTPLSRSRQEELRQLLGVTAIDEQLEECFQFYCEQKVHANTAPAKDNKRRRNRRRRKPRRNDDT